MFQRYARTAMTAAALSLAGLLPTAAWAQGDSDNPNVISDGFEDLSYGKTFYIQVPMIDAPSPVVSLVNPRPSSGGIGDNVTAESIINNVRYVGEHPDINHIVFLMRTGGGLMFHADAMLDVIEEYHDTTEYTIIIEHAISAGTWTVFSCDNIFMIDGGTVGGAVGYVTLQDGTPIVADNLAFVAARMGKVAERNGHSALFMPAMMHQPAELHYWEVNGEGVLSDKAPSSPNSVDNYHLIDSDQDVLTLTTAQAEMVGLAERISGYHADLVGEKIGVPGWRRANHYGQVVHEIADIYNVTRVDQDFFERSLASIPYFRDNRDNRDNPQIAAVLEERATYKLLLDGYSTINEALNNLPYVHPERHIYFTDAEGRTILADPEQWKQDTQASRNYARSFRGALSNIRRALAKLDIDAGNISDLEDALEDVANRIEGIARQGNAAYWAENEVVYEIE